MVKETKKEGKARKKGRRCVSVLPLVLEGVCACMRARMKKRKKKKDQKGRKVKEKGRILQCAVSNETKFNTQQQLKKTRNKKNPKVKEGMPKDKEKPKG